MAHKTLIDGTSYNIVGGSTLIDGVKRAIAAGKTLIDGTSFAIVFGSKGFEWGDEDAEADAAWFASLADYLADNDPDESWVGKEKSITLTTEVLGTATHKIRCIGVNQDGDRTVAFQTNNCLMDEVGFGSSEATTVGGGAYWGAIDCVARAKCQEYYDAFPGKASIKTVSKGTCDHAGSSKRTSTPVYTNEDVWLPSEREMGLDTYAPISAANSTTTNSECTYGYNEPYDYYTNNARRIKKFGDNGANTGYWQRSRYYGSTAAGVVCIVDSNGEASGFGYSRLSGLSPAFVIGPTNIITSFDWGSESTEATAQWFADLKSYLKNNPGQDSWVGKEKVVVLTSEVLGTTTHKIRCIGVNQDGENTVTFQTSNSLNTTTKYSSLSNISRMYARGTNYHDSANLIYDSNVSGACKLYYNAFPGKASIKKVNKGTCLTQVSEQNGTATYSEQYVWIPSEGEVGLDNYASLKYSNWTEANGECTYGKKFQYSYYTTNARRVKKDGDSGSAGYWWLRGHYYNSANAVCAVNSTGAANYYSYGSSHGFAPCFVIGN